VRNGQYSDKISKADQSISRTKESSDAIFHCVYFCLACGSCAHSPGGAPLAAISSQQSGPVIARIVQRHQTIVIRSGSAGPTYSLESPGGELLTKDMTMGELAMKNPELFRRVKAMQDNLLCADLSSAD
jgi:hypothetical protein